MLGGIETTARDVTAATGPTFEFAQRSQLTVAYATPIGGGSDREYNGGLQVFLNHPIGR